MIRCVGQVGMSYRLALRGSIRDVECAVLLSRLHSRKLKELEEKLASLSKSL
jgi:hypothetical protein